MKKLLCFAGIIAGNFILSFGVVAFVLPHGLIAGGSTGLGLALQHYLGLPVAGVVAAANIILFFSGLFFLGWKFAATSLISTILYPVLLSLTQLIPSLQNLTDNLLLAAIFAGVLMGLGVGLVLKVGGSTGGFDIPPLILNRKLNVPVSTTLYTVDTVIVLSQVTFSNPEQIMYGLIVVFLCSAVVNKVLVMGTAKVQLLIISDEHEKIRQMLLHTLDSGVTLFQIENGIRKTRQNAILSIISNRKLVDAKTWIQEIDDQAFIMISSITEVRGRGFTLERQTTAPDREE